MNIIQELHDSEINCSLSTFFDGCFDVRLGDVHNGFKAEAHLSSFEEVEEWLLEQVAMHYPNSVFMMNQ